MGHPRSWPFALLAAASLSCGDGGRGAASSSSSGSSARAPDAPPASAAPAVALTKEAFCERAVKLGEARLAKCTKDDQNQRTYLDFKPLVEGAKQACADRVGAAQVEFHADAAAACLEAAEKRVGPTAFATFSEIPACRGVLTGKVAKGGAAKFGEACAAGLSLRKGTCEPPAAVNAACGWDGRGVLGKPEDHPACEPGAACRDEKCVKAALGERCDPMLGNCPDGSTCHQGKCRALAPLGGACMHDAECADGNRCDLPGGLFGRCAPRRALGEACKEHSSCVSDHCRASKCASFCGGGG